MSTPFNNPEPTGIDPGQGNSEVGNNNPAWNDVLNVIHKEFHSQVTPHFSNWDKGVQDKINNVRGEYATYEPYKAFVESQVSPDDLRMGYGLLQAIYKEPLRVIQAMQESFGLDLSELLGSQENNDPDPSIDANIAQLPIEVQQQLARLQQQSDTMGQLLLRQREEALEAEEAKKLDDEFAALKQKYGDFDEEIVLTLMLNNYSAENAVQRYLQHVNGIRTANNKPPAPQLLGSGSAIPDRQVDPRKLNARQTKDLVTEMLKAAAGGS